MTYKVATEMVRHAFVKDGYESALFDSWLAGILQEERERIIALLESNLFTDKGLGNIRVSDLISLIKGDKK